MTPSRRAGLVIFLVLALLTLADAAAWFWATGRMVVEWDSWRSRAAAQGVQVQAGEPVRGGWPFAADITLQGIAIDAGVASWRADRMTLGLSPFHPTSLAIAVHGRQSLRLDGLPPVDIAARGLTAAVPLNDPQQIMFEGHSITVSQAGSSPAGGSQAGGSLAIGVLAGRLDPAGLDIAASHLMLPEAGLPFGGGIERATARLHMTGPVPSAAALQHASVAAANWSRAGGQLIVDDARLVWGPLDAQGRFTAGLDAALQPTATGTLHMSGYHAAIDALVRAGTIGRNAARVANTVLDMMATSTDPAVVDVPLTLRGGSVAMGAIPLLRIAPIAWP